MKTPLTLQVIESFNLPKKPIKPDWDDAGYSFELPNGIDLEGLYMCNNHPTEMDCLEGLNGFIYIETKEELEELISLSFEEVIIKIAEKNPDFEVDNYL